MRNFEQPQFQAAGSTPAESVESVPNVIDESLADQIQEIVGSLAESATDAQTMLTEVSKRLAAAKLRFLPGVFETSVKPLIISDLRAWIRDKADESERRYHEGQGYDDNLEDRIGVVSRIVLGLERSKPTDVTSSVEEPEPELVFNPSDAEIDAVLDRDFVGQIKPPSSEGASREVSVSEKISPDLVEEYVKTLLKDLKKEKDMVVELDERVFVIAGELEEKYPNLSDPDLEKQVRVIFVEKLKSALDKLKIMEASSQIKTGKVNLELASLISRVGGVIRQEEAPKQEAA